MIKICKSSMHHCSVYSTGDGTIAFTFFQCYPTAALIFFVGKNNTALTAGGTGYI